MTPHSHSNHPLYAFLRPEQPSASNRQQTQSLVYEKCPSNSLSRSQSRNEKQNVVTKDLVSILTTHRLANTLNLITQRLDSLESNSQTGQKELGALIGSAKSETEIIAKATSDRVSCMLEPYLSTLQTKLPVLETHVDALRSEIVSRALNPAEPTAHQCKVEHDIGRLQDSFQRHTTASTNAQSQDHERISILEQEFKTLNNSILPLSTLSPLLQSFLQAELSRQSTSREKIQKCEPHHPPGTEVDQDPIAHENQETDLETLEASQVVTTPTFQSCLTGIFNESQRLEIHQRTTAQCARYQGSRIATVSRNYGRCNIALSLKENNIQNLKISVRRNNIITNASQEAQNISTQDHPNSEPNVRKSSRSSQIPGVPKRYLTRAHQASNPHLCYQPDLDILGKGSKNPEKVTLKSNVSEKTDESRSLKTRKLNPSLGNKVERQSPSTQSHRTLSSSLNPKRYRRQLFEVEVEGDEQNRS
ncbi:hypothetical protein DFH28DRAFT_950020 [Melampsora americana]|nr:hypothetical protein DFH28DRAFT_950020 [Melampsora americana]